jgi:hypothetical protein
MLDDGSEATNVLQRVDCSFHVDWSEKCVFVLTPDCRLQDLIDLLANVGKKHSLF